MLNSQLNQMKHQVARIHPADNVLVALADLPIGTEVPWENGLVTTTEAIPAKHKLAPARPERRPARDHVRRAGGHSPRGHPARRPPHHGQHSARHQQLRRARPAARRLAGPRRERLARPHLPGLPPRRWPRGHRQLLAGYSAGVLRKPQHPGAARCPDYRPRLRPPQKLPARNPQAAGADAGRQIGGGNPERRPAKPARTRPSSQRPFPNVDGIRFLTHEGGCGGIRQDAQTLCGLLAGYITHPNVAGATVLSLGCQNAQATMLQDEIDEARPAASASRSTSSTSRSSAPRKPSSARPCARLLPA